MGALLGLAAIVAIGLLALGQRDDEGPTVDDVPENTPGRPPTPSAIETAREVAARLVAQARAHCPAAETNIAQLVSTFETAVSGNARDALVSLQEGLRQLLVARGCGPVTEDPTTPRSATDLARALQAEANPCPSEGTVRAFQAAHNRETPATGARVPESGLYDFATAVAVQMYLSAAGSGLAPQVCAFPEFDPSDVPFVEQGTENVRAAVDALLGSLRGGDP